MHQNIKENLKRTYNAHACEREKNEMQDWKVRPRDAFLRLFRDESKQSLLEIGAGHGRDSKFFMDRGLNVTAVDFSSEMVRLCRGRGIEAYEMDFFNLSSLHRTFDAVWALNCLLHVEKENLGRVLDEIDSVLNPSGLFFMGVYGGENREGVWENDVYTPKRFFSFYTDEGIQKAVAGFFDMVSFERVDTGRDLHFQSIVMRKKDK